MKSSFPKGVRSIFIKIEFFILTYRFFIALSSKINKFMKLSMESDLKSERKISFVPKGVRSIGSFVPKGVRSTG